MNTEVIVGRLSAAACPPAFGRGWRLLAAGLAGVVLAWPAAAQTAATATPATATAPPSSDAATRERLQRDAERPMYWIRLHAEQARAAEARKATPVASPAPVPAALAAPRPAKVSAAALDKLPPTAAGPAPAAVADVPLATRADRAEEVPAVAPNADARQADAGSLPTALPEAAAAPPTTLAAASPQAEPLPYSATRAALASASAPLQLLHATDPDFPASLVRRLRRGELQVQVEVDDTGSVRDAKVLNSSHPRLNEPALDAIRSWRFRPPAQPASAVIRFRFDIDETG